MFRIDVEIASQPTSWSTALERLPTLSSDLPAAGERVVVLGCGTSFYVAEAVARRREELGAGETDAVVASEFAAGRPYDRVLAISRSGTTTEVVRALEASRAAGIPSVAITAVAPSPLTEAADASVLLEFADEESVVQTRFASTTLALLRAHAGEDLARAIDEGRDATERALPVDPSGFEHFVFLGTGWSVGIADEAALKLREAGLAWSESYPAMEYRHGPISVASDRTLVWSFGALDAELAADVRATGATVVGEGLDPMAELILVQRAAVGVAVARGLDPDHPRHLTRSVVLS